jgi:hypothetical protein
MISINNFQGRLSFDIKDKPTEAACLSVMQSEVKQMRYKLKKKYFTGILVDQIRTTSPVPFMTDAQWNQLVQKWLDPKTMVCLSATLSLYQQWNFELLVVFMPI